ncbi:MAG: dipeptidase [Candidatus Sumerlaeaceae bacterium]|nr:dipeptidase [Candidatus Sumerlaeaceae bacterium]
MTLAPVAANLPPIIMDGHCDVLLRLRDNGHTLTDPTEGDHHVDIPRWRAGGVNAVFFVAWINADRYPAEQAVHRTWDLIAAFHEQLALHPDELAHCRTAREVRAACGAGRIASLLAVEGGVALNEDLSLIAKYREAGVRYLTLTWQGNLSWVGSSHLNDGESPMGLTEFGADVVREMNRTGLVVDLSHVSDEAFYDVLRVSERPVLVTHSNSRTLSNHSRNLTDDMLRALADNDGMAGINLYSGFLEPKGRGSSHPEAVPVTIDTVLDHIDHMVQVAGINHVGLGTDWEGMKSPAQGLESADRMPALISGLRGRGYSEGDINKIAAENLLRVLEANEG